MEEVCGSEAVERQTVNHAPDVIRKTSVESGKRHCKEESLNQGRKNPEKDHKDRSEQDSK
jgi:hypothetical protein